MKNKEVKDLVKELRIVSEYCVDKDIRNFTLNRVLSRNTKILAEAEKEIDEVISKELIDLEKKMVGDSEEKWLKIPEDSKDPVGRFYFALSNSSDEDKEKHSELMKEYNELLQEANDVNLYILEDVSKIERVDLPLPYHNILEKFLKQD